MYNFTKDQQPLVPGFIDENHHINYAPKPLQKQWHEINGHYHAVQWVGSLEIGKTANFLILEEFSPLNMKKNSVNTSQKTHEIRILESWKAGCRICFNQDKSLEKRALIRSH